MRIVPRVVMRPDAFGDDVLYGDEYQVCRQVSSVLYIPVTLWVDSPIGRMGVRSQLLHTVLGWGR